MLSRILPLSLALASLSTLAFADEKEIIARFNTSFSDISALSAEPIENGALYRVMLSNGSMIHSTPDGKLFTDGVLWSISSLAPVNLTEKANIHRIMSLDSDDLIVFKAPNETHKVTVFTDISCSYCRLLHSHMDEYNALGITIQYAAFPRAGERSRAFPIMQDVWCSSDRKQALTDAMTDIAIPSNHCTNPVSNHFELGLGINVSGTPTIVTKSSIIGGYIEPKSLLKALDHEKTI